MQKVNPAIKSLLRDILNRKEIDKKIIEYLLIKRPPLSRFYLLPKNAGRPVIANNGTATENISAFVDFHLFTIVSTVSHILEDTRDFLSRLNERCEIPENAYLVLLNAVGLYLHMPYEEGLEILKSFLDKSEDQSVSSKNLCRKAKIILKHDYFELRSDRYHQLLATAIGTRFVPNYANIFMGGLEENLFKKLKFKSHLWLRYLDDVFCI